jgi:hypothetical protein
VALLVRILLTAGGGVAALFVAQDSPNFEVVQGMLALVVAVAVLILVGLAGRR